MRATIVTRLYTIGRHEPCDLFAVHTYHQHSFELQLLELAGITPNAGFPVDLDHCLRVHVNLQVR